MEIFEAANDDYYDECWYYTKGWVDQTEFLKAIMEKYGEIFDLENDDAGDVVHGYVRIYGKKDKTIMFDKSYKAHRGCFKATFVCAF